MDKIERLKYEISAEDRVSSVVNEATRWLTRFGKEVNDINRTGFVSDKNLTQLKEMSKTLKEIQTSGKYGTIPSAAGGGGGGAAGGGEGVLGTIGRYTGQNVQQYATAAGMSAGIIGTAYLLSKRGEALSRTMDETAIQLNLYSENVDKALGSYDKLNDEVISLSAAYGEHREVIMKLGAIASRDISDRNKIYAKGGLAENALQMAPMTMMTSERQTQFLSTLMRFGMGTTLPAQLYQMTQSSQMNLGGGRRGQFIEAVADSVEKGLSRGVAVHGENVARTMGIFNIAGARAKVGGELIRGPQATQMWESLQGGVTSAANFGNDATTGAMIRAARRVKPNATPEELKMMLEEGFQGEYGIQMFREVNREAEMQGGTGGGSAAMALQTLARGRGTIRQWRTFRKGMEGITDEDLQQQLNDIMAPPEGKTYEDIIKGFQETRFAGGMPGQAMVGQVAIQEEIINKLSLAVVEFTSAIKSFVGGIGAISSGDDSKSIPVRVVKSPAEKMMNTRLYKGMANALEGKR